MKKQQNTVKWLNLFLLVINISAFITILFMNRDTAGNNTSGASFSSDLFLKEELKLSDEHRITSYNVCYTKLLRFAGV